MTMPSVLPSYFAVTVTSVAKAKRARYAPPFSNAAGEAVSMTMLVFLAGWTFISARMARTALM